MSRYNHMDRTDIYRALVVDEHGSADWDEYLRQRSRADDGRDPASGATPEWADEDVPTDDRHTAGEHA